MDTKVDLIWKKLTVKTNDTFILDECSGKAYNSSITVVVGGTGSGKSVLFEILAGRLNNDLIISGDVRIDDNNRDRKNIHTSSLKTGSIVVLIDETFYFLEKQTVWETIYFAVHFFNINEPDSILKEKTQFIISTLDLNKKSGQMLFELSQGEKKLVYIGTVLAEDPSIILIDDPFDYLDKWHVTRIFTLLKKLTKRSKTILIAISAPYEEVLKRCDKIFILANHSFIFEGTYLQYRKFYSETGMDPNDFVNELVTIDYSSEGSRIKDTQKIRELKHKWYTNNPINEDLTEYQIIKYTEQKKSFKKISLIMKRHLQIFTRSKDAYMTLVLQKLIFFIISIIAYPIIGYTQEDIQTRYGLISFLLLNNIDRSLSIVLSSVSISRFASRREIIFGLYTSTEAYIAEYIFDFLLIYFASVLYMIPVYWIAQVNNNFYRFSLFLINHFFLTNFTVAYAIFVNVATCTPREASMFGALGLLFFSAFSGIFINVETLHNFAYWITWISPLYYAFEFNLQVSLSNLRFVCDSESCYKTGREALEDMKLIRIDKFISLAIFIMFIVFFIFLGVIVMAIKFKPRMKNEKINIFQYFLVN